MVKPKVIAGIAAGVVAAVLVVTLSITLTRNGGDSPSSNTTSAANQGSTDTTSVSRSGSSISVAETPDPIAPAPAPEPDALTPVPDAPAPVADAPAPVPDAPAPAPLTQVPTPVADAPAPEVDAPEPAADAPEPTLDASAPELALEPSMPAQEPETIETAASPIPEQPPAAQGGLFGYFHWNGAGCPAVGGPGHATALGTPAGNPSFVMKDEMKEYYAGPGKHVPIQNGNIKLDYPKVTNGATYCKPAAGKKILVGGTVLFKKGNTCSLPPTKGNGDSCCSMKIWQPNNEGFYENDCSVTVEIGGDGTWWLYTELPGDETNGGYSDDQAHLHYDIRCKGCNTGPFNTLKTERGEGWWNKWWQEKLCTAPQCGKTGKQHLSIDKSVKGGVKTYKYHSVIVYK